MLVKTNKFDKKGDKIYVNAFTGQEQVLSRVRHRKNGKIPSDVYGRFIIPQNKSYE